jgi:large exoprotein involved in heme utilization and adhesion
MQASGDIIVRNGSHIETSPFIDATAGHTGAVWITASGAITVSNQGERGAPSSISSFAAGGVDAGNIVITAGHSIAIEGQLADNLSSHISSEATTGGQSGDITLMSPILHIDGGILSSGITVDFFSVNAGDIVVRAETVTLVNGGRIDSSHRGSLQGGTITITAQESITIAGTSIEGRPSGIRSRPFGKGNAGRVALTTPILDIEGGDVSTVAFGAGRAGDITINAAHLVVAGGGTISSSTVGEGEGGTITITAQSVELSNGATIAAARTSRGNAGNIRITQGQSLLLSDNSAITTQAAQSGGGNISMETKVLSLTDSGITAEAQGASQMGSNGGNVTIRANQMVVNRGFVRANAFGGDGRQINIMASGAFLADATTCASFECLNASSELGISGTVEVQSPVTNLSEAVTPLSLSFGPDIAVLRDRCTPRLREGNVTRLVDRSHDRVATHPDGLSPRRLYQPTPVTGLPRHETGWYAASVESDSVNHLRLGETMGWRHYQQNTHLPPLCH